MRYSGTTRRYAFVDRSNNQTTEANSVKISRRPILSKRGSHGFQAVSDRPEMKDVPEMARDLQPTDEVVRKGRVMDVSIFSSRSTPQLMTEIRFRKESNAADSNGCLVLKGTDETKKTAERPMRKAGEEKTNCDPHESLSSAGGGDGGGGDSFFSRTASVRSLCSSAAKVTIKRTQVKELSGLLMRSTGINASTQLKPVNRPPTLSLTAALNSFSGDLIRREENSSLVSTDDVETSACTVHCESDKEEDARKEHKINGGVDYDGDRQTAKVAPEAGDGHSSLTTDCSISSAASRDFGVESTDSGITDTSSSCSNSSSGLIASHSTGIGKGERDRGGRTEATRESGPQSRAIVVRGFSHHASNIFNRRK